MIRHFSCVWRPGFAKPTRIPEFSGQPWGATILSLSHLASTEILRYKYDPDSRLTNRWSVAKGDTKYQ